MVRSHNLFVSLVVTSNTGLCNFLGRGKLLLQLFKTGMIHRSKGFNRVGLLQLQLCKIGHWGPMEEMHRHYKKHQHQQGLIYSWFEFNLN